VTIRRPSSRRDLYPGYSFTPDSKELVTTWEGKIRRVDVTTGALRDVPFTATVTQHLGPRLSFPYRVEEGAVKARLIHDASPVADGKRLAFSSLTDIYVLDLPKGQPAPRGAGQRQFSQPGHRRAVDRLRHVVGSRGRSLWKARADGRAGRWQLTRPARSTQNPVWSPDGTRVVALRGSRFMRDESPKSPAGCAFRSDLMLGWRGGQRGRNPHFRLARPRQAALRSREGPGLRLRWQASFRRMAARASSRCVSTVRIGAST